MRLKGIDRRRFCAGLRAKGIGTQVHYLPVNAFPLYRQLGYEAASTPIATEVAEQLVSLPLYPAMSDDDVARVIAAVRVVVNEGA